MADTIFDILVRTTFEAADEELKAANGDIERQSQLVKEAQANLERLAVSQKNAATATQQQAVNRELDKANKLTQEAINLSARQRNAAFSLTQVLRETPSLSNSFQQFFLAISNNVPILVDNVQSLKKANTEAAEAGQKVESIGVTLGKSLFSLNNIITLGIAAITIFGNELFKTSDKAAELKKNTDELTDSLIKEAEALDKVNQRFRYLDTDETTNAIKRQIELLKARGAVNGEVYKQDKDIHDAEQKLRAEENVVLGQQINTYKKLRETVEEAARGVDPNKDGFFSKKSNLNFIKTVFQNAPADVPRETLDKLLSDIKKNGLKGQELRDALFGSVDEYSKRIEELNQKQLDKNNDIDAADTDFKAKQTEKQYNLYLQLQEKLRALRLQGIELEKEVYQESLDLVKDRIQRQADAEIGSINREQEQARKQGALSPQNVSYYNQIRQQIQDNAYREQQQAATAFYQKQYQQEKAAFDQSEKQELQNLQDKAKIHADDLQLQQQALDKELAANLDAINERYDDEYSAAIKLKQDTTDIERQRQEAITNATEEGNQKRLDLQIKNLQRQEKDLSAQLAISLAKISADADKELQETKDPTKKALINNSKDILSNLAKQVEAQKELRLAQNNLDILTSSVVTDALQGRTPVVSDEQLTAAKKNIAELVAQIEKLRTELGNLQNGDTAIKVDATVQQIAQYGQLTDAALNAANAIVSIEKDKTDALISENERRVERAKELAKYGNATILKQEQDRLDSSIRAQQRYERTIAGINALLIISQNAVNVATAIGAVLKSADKSNVITLIVTLVAATAAIAGAIASVKNSAKVNSSGFFKGDYTGDGDPHDEAGIVHKREFVFDHKATDRIGVENLRKLKEGKLELLEKHDYGRLEINPDGMLQPQIDYAGMLRTQDFIRNYQIQSTADLSKLERRIAAMDKNITEAIDNMPVTSFNWDKDGAAMSIRGHIKHLDKLNNMRK